MGKQVMSFSDLTKKLVPDERQLGRLVVLSHPELTNGPVVVEALPGEVKDLGRLSVSAAIVEWQGPEDEEPTRYIVPLEAFNALAKDGDMAGVLTNAQPLIRPRSTSSGDRERRDYTQPPWARLVHRGKVTDEEAAYVREHLDEVNQRRAAQDPPQPPINPSDPEDAKRYGFPTLVEPGATG